MTPERLAEIEALLTSPDANKVREIVEAGRSLLAEVKRLREEMQDLNAQLDNWSDEARR